MGPPGITYRYIYPKDIAGPTLELFSRAVFVSAVNATVTIDITGIPKDKAFLLENVAAAAAPGAAQTADRVSFSLFTHTGTFFHVLDEFPTEAAAQTTGHNWQGSVWVLGGGAAEVVLRINATFNAGVNANTLNVGVFGFVIPRANLAVF